MVPTRPNIVLAALALASVTTLATGRASAELSDLRGPIRVGAGWSNVWRAPVLALSFEDEMSLWKLGRSLQGQLVFGMDGVRGPQIPTPPFTPTQHQSLLAVDLGTGLLWRPMRESGPAFVVSATMGPTWTGGDDLAPKGLGLIARGEIFPFYESVKEIVQKCRHGALYSYALGGLHGWAMGRQDFVGASSGTAYAFGVGLDLAREFILPIMEAVLSEPICGGAAD